MSKILYFGRASLMALLLAALATGVAFARGGGGGGGHGGGGGGGFHGGGGGGFRGGGGWGGGYRGGGYSGGWSGGTRAGTFNSVAPSHAWSGGEFAHPGTAYSANRLNSGSGWNNLNHGWTGQHGNWTGHHEWDNYFGRGGYGGWGWGGYWPWFAGWGLGWGWGYPYDYGYYYPDAGDYYYSYAPTGDASGGAVVDSGAAAPEQFASTPGIAPAVSTATGAQQEANEALQYYSAARESFFQGDYHNALRLAGHAGVDAPRNPKVHELTSLALFALGNYRAAASEAHAAMALGAIADWKDLYGYYNDANKYTTELRALETAAASHAQDAADHFLLGYHYLMIGARDNATTQFASAAKLTPGDKLASHYLQELKSHAPLTPPEMATRPGGKTM